MASETVVLGQDDLTVGDLAEIQALLDDAFADDPLSEEDWEHCQGGRHVLTREGGRLVAYAAVVAREMLLDGRLLQVGYVEGVGVLRSRQRRGLGGTVMAPIEALVPDVHDALALSTSDEGLPFYLARGWRAWPGRTYVDTSAAPHDVPRLRRTAEEDESLLVWPHGPFADLGPDTEIACRARSGDDW